MFYGYTFLETCLLFRCGSKGRCIRVNFGDAANKTLCDLGRGAGVEEGGRSGLTAFVTGICFLLAVFFAPFFLSVPASATAPVLVPVGLMMMASVMEIDFNDFSESVPAFLCIVCMPLCYSISDGIILGHLCYVILNTLCGKWKKVTIGMYIIALLFILKLCFLVN